MSALAFHAVIRIRGINPYIAVSAERAAVLRPGWRKPLPVLARINGLPARPHRTNVMPAGDGSFYLYLNDVIRKAAGVSVGNRVRVELAFDPHYRNGPQHPMPAWFRRALAQRPRAQANWSVLSPSRRKEVLRYFAGLKSTEARDRNLTRALDVLSGKPGRFMARDWHNGA